MIKLTIKEGPDFCENFNVSEERRIFLANKLDEIIKEFPEGRIPLDKTLVKLAELCDNVEELLVMTVIHTEFCVKLKQQREAELFLKGFHIKQNAEDLLNEVAIKMASKDIN